MVMHSVSYLQSIVFLMKQSEQNVLENDDTDVLSLEDTPFNTDYLEVWFYFGFICLIFELIVRANT